LVLKNISNLERINSDADSKKGDEDSKLDDEMEDSIFEETVKEKPKVQNRYLIQFTYFSKTVMLVYRFIKNLKLNYQKKHCLDHLSTKQF
jgi:hypothetical protein